MTDREKLIALMNERCNSREACPMGPCFECVADHLIANGVTVQRWIPVTERLPEVGADILVCHKNGFVATNAWLGTHWWFKDDKNTITHWMPLPEPPKEGE